jgi:hypothetical protein
VRFIAPAMIQEAVRPSQRKAAMKVWVPQWPNGAWALSRWPRPASQPGHLRGGGGLIEEHQPVRLLAHPGLAVVPPGLAVPRHITATDLGRQQCFF